MEYDKYYSEKYGGYIESPALPETDGGIDWDKIWLNYTLELNRQEAWELYESCVLPDIADNALGRIWVLQGSDYAATVCAASVEVDARWPDENERRTPELVYDGTPGTLPMAVAEDGTRYYGFSTTPTVDSARTNAFFAAHGLHVSTIGEINAALG